MLDDRESYTLCHTFKDLHSVFGITSKKAVRMTHAKHRKQRNKGEQNAVFESAICPLRSWEQNRVYVGMEVCWWMYGLWNGRELLVYSFTFHMSRRHEERKMSFCDWQGDTRSNTIHYF
jgi:hypothetical protein